MKFNLTKNVDLKVITQNYKKQFPNVFKFYKLSEFYIFGNVGLQLIPLEDIPINTTLMYSDFETLEKKLDLINKNNGILQEDKHFLNLYYVKKLIGRTEQEAIIRLQCDNIDFRILSADDINYICNDEKREDRINLMISNNKVIESYIG